MKEDSYQVGQRQVQDVWLKGVTQGEYNTYLQKSFQLMRNVSRIEYMTENDKDNFLKIEEIHQEIEHIGQALVNSKQQNQEEKDQETNLKREYLHTYQTPIPFQKTSKILGKALIRQAYVDKKAIIVIEGGKEKKNIPIGSFLYQIEKTEALISNGKIQTDSKLKDQKSSASKQSQIKIIKEFRPSNQPEQNNKFISQLKWVDQKYLYRIIIRNLIDVQEFEYALYFTDYLELVKVRDTIKQGLINQCTSIDCKQTFLTLAKRWKREVASKVKQQMSDYKVIVEQNNLNAAQFRSTFSKETNTLRSSVSQDFVNNRNSQKQMMFRNNLSLAENQLNLLNQLDDLKDRQSIQEVNQDERDQVIQLMLEKRQKSNSSISNSGGERNQMKVNDNLNNNQEENNLNSNEESLNFYTFIQNKQQPFQLNENSSDHTEANQKQRSSSSLSKQEQQAYENIHSREEEEEKQQTGLHSKKRSLFYGKPQLEIIQEGSSSYQNSQPSQKIIPAEENKIKKPARSLLGKDAISVPFTDGTQSVDEFSYSRDRSLSQEANNQSLSIQQQHQYTPPNEATNIISSSPNSTSQLVPPNSSNKQKPNIPPLQFPQIQMISDNKSQQQNKLIFSQNPPSNPSSDSQNSGIQIIQSLVFEPKNTETEVVNQEDSNKQIKLKEYQLLQKQYHKLSTLQEEDQEHFSMDTVQDKQMEKPKQSQFNQQQPNVRQELSPMKRTSSATKLQQSTSPPQSLHENKSEKILIENYENEQYQQRSSSGNKTENITKQKSINALNKIDKEQTFLTPSTKESQIISQSREILEVNQDQILASKKTHSSGSLNQQSQVLSSDFKINRDEIHQYSHSAQSSNKQEVNRFQSNPKTSEFLPRIKQYEKERTILNTTTNQYVPHQQEVINNKFEIVTFYLQKIELISPSKEPPLDIIVQLKLTKIEDQIEVQQQSVYSPYSSERRKEQLVIFKHEWNQFKTPITRVEDNYLYSVHENFKKSEFNIDPADNYYVEIQVCMSKGYRVLGSIKVRLADIVDITETGKDFWLLCPISSTVVPFALLNVWTSMQNQSEDIDFQQYTKQIYSLVNKVHHPYYLAPVYFPELYANELESIERLMISMGYQEEWLMETVQSQDRVNSKVSSHIDGSFFKEIKRCFQYGFSNRMGFAQANLFIQENMYARLFAKLRDNSLPPKEVACHFHQLCLEGIPYSQRQEIYLELLDVKTRINSLKGDFICYTACNPAQQPNLQFSHISSDIFLSPQLNKTITQVQQFLRSPQSSIMDLRFTFYQILSQEAHFYSVGFSIDFTFPFAESIEQAVRILETLSFVMQIQGVSYPLQFNYSFHNILNKCLILNCNDKQKQESESFWLLYGILSQFNLSNQEFQKYFHLIESSTNYQTLSNIIGSDCLMGLFSGSFHEELCFRCWDVLFMEVKRKSWDVLGYLSCLGIAICNKYQITSSKEWEIFGKYFTNFTELNRIVKETYEMLLGNNRNRSRWEDKQQLSEQLLIRKVDKYHFQKITVQNTTSQLKLSFNMEGIQKVVAKAQKNNYFAGKHLRGKQNLKTSQQSTFFHTPQKKRPPASPLSEIQYSSSDQKTKYFSTNNQNQNWISTGNESRQFNGNSHSQYISVQQSSQNNHSLSSQQHSLDHQFVGQTDRSYLEVSDFPKEEQKNFETDFVFMKENLHIYIQQIEGLKQMKKQTSNLHASNVSLRVGNRDIQFEDDNEFRVEKYNFFESVEHTPLLLLDLKVFEYEYSCNIDLRKFNRGVMYQQIAFLKEKTRFNEIAIEFNILVENCQKSFQQEKRILNSGRAYSYKKTSTSNSKYAPIFNSPNKIHMNLHNDVCLNWSPINEPQERNKEFEQCFNNQNLLESGLNHFVYSRNILTREHRVFQFSEFESEFLEIAESQNKLVFTALLNELTLNNSEDLIGVLQIILLFTDVSFESKMRVLFSLFELRYPNQTSDDLEAYLLDFCMRLEINCLSLRDIQLLIRQQDSYQFGLTEAYIDLEQDRYDVSEYFCKEFAPKLCKNYLLLSINICQSFIIEDVLREIREQQSQQQYRNMNTQANSQYNSLLPQIKGDQQLGVFTVKYLEMGKQIAKSVFFEVNQNNIVTILPQREVSLPMKALFSKTSQAIRNKSIITPLTQLRGWINMSSLEFIGDYQTFKKYTNHLKFLEPFMMQKSSFVPPNKPINITQPILLKVVYGQSLQLFCDPLFRDSQVHNFYQKESKIEYLNGITIDHALISLIPRIIGRSAKFITKHIIVKINNKIITDMSTPLRQTMSASSASENIQVGLLTVELITRSKDNINNNYTNEDSNSNQIQNCTPAFNGYALWNICSQKQFLPCKISLKKNIIKRESQSLEYTIDENIFRWY